MSEVKDAVKPIDSTEAVLSKLDQVEASIKKDVQAMVEEQVATAVKEAVAASEAKVTDQLVAFEGKIASAPTVITERASLREHANKRVKKELREWSKGAGLASQPINLKLFESEGEYEAYMREASGLVNVGGSGKGGRVIFDPTFFVLRQMNPLRGIARTVGTSGSDYTFVAKVGNSGVAYGYTPNVTTAGATNTLDTAIWNVTLSSQNVQFATRTAILDDVPGLESSLIDDLMLEFSQVEGQTSVGNDFTGSTTPTLGGANAWRGLDFYAGANATYTGGTATTASIVAAGNHNLGTYDQITKNATGGANNVSYKDLINFIHSLPVPYWSPNNKFMVSPTFLAGLRGLTDTAGASVLYRYNAQDRGIVTELLGYEVIVNSYLDTGIVPGAAGVNNLYPMYFGNFDLGYTYVDRLEMRMLRALETVPGSLTLWAERRVSGAVKNPAAFLRYRSTNVAT